MTTDGTSLADWISAISQLAFLLIFVLLFVGANQRFQMYLWGKEVRASLGIFYKYYTEAEEKTRDMLVRNGAKRPKTIVDRIKDYVTISPVDIEPTDIIRRLDHILTTERNHIKELLLKEMPERDKSIRYKIETSLEITYALNMIYKIVRHYLITSEKTNNYILLMQLKLILPQILKIAESYRKALDDFAKGAPIGDAIGPLIAHRIARFNGTPEWINIDEDTVASLVEFENRKIILVKASGPESNVGRPGVAIEEIIEKDLFKTGKPRLLITVDAALKLEGEDTGSVAEGVGAAIGDPGPEKIRIERVATKYGIPLRTVIIKMGMEEAIYAMREEIYKGGVEALNRIKTILKEETQNGDVVLLAGIGNSMGVSQ
ncbi:MAG: DUF1512 domain-containing protein [Desulfurococcales archaeon]|nr:DUF1512 domain-containing protein [Desulfurococcales archaeon]